MLNTPEPTIYNKEDVYKSKVEPLLYEIKRICALNQIPFYASFAVANSDKETKYINDGVFTGSAGIELTNNLLESYLLVNCGGHVVPTSKEEMIDNSIDYIMSDFDDEEINDNLEPEHVIDPDRIPKKRGRKKKTSFVNNLGEL